MSTEDNSKQNVNEDPQGFPWELKILLVVIAFGVIIMALKATGLL